MGFKYVFIPASPNEDMQELEYHSDVHELEKDSFRDFLQQYFASLGGTVDRNILLDQLKQRTGVDLKGKDGPDVERLLSCSSVEIFPLLLPTKDSRFEAISVYCDDKGVAKGLEDNMRMTGLAKVCGYPQQIFKGDVFIGRVYDDNEEKWERQDFTLKDVNADASWVGVTKHQRKPRSSSDMSTMANMVGMKNAAHVNASTIADADPKGETDTYCWRQAEDEIEVTFKKEGLQKGEKKDVKVVFGKQRLKVEAKGEVLLDAELFAAQTPDEATWTLADGVLQVTMTKAEKSTWSRLLKKE